MRRGSAQEPSAESFWERAVAVLCSFSCRRNGGEALRVRLKNLLCIPFKFSTRGSHVVVYEPEEMYDQSLASERNVIYGQARENERVWRRGRYRGWNLPIRQAQRCH